MLFNVADHPRHMGQKLFPEGALEGKEGSPEVDPDGIVASQGACDGIRADLSVLCDGDPVRDESVWGYGTHMGQCGLEDLFPWGSGRNRVKVKQDFRREIAWV